MDELTSCWSLSCASALVSMNPVEVGILRIVGADAEVTRELARLFGFAWPILPNRMAGEAVRAAWLCPGAWAVFGQQDEIASSVAKACAGRPYHFVDVSAGHSLWLLSGASATRLLARACSIDTHPAVFSKECCARSLFAQVPALIMAGDVSGTFRLLVDASFDGHLQAWFSNALQDVFQ